MLEIQDSEYILFKEASQQILEKLPKSLKKLNIKGDKALAKYEKQKDLFLNSEKYDDLGFNSSSFKKKQKELILLLSIQNRIENILKRNKKRVEFIDTKLSLLGIYNHAVDKKLLTERINKEVKNVTAKDLNLNPNQNNDVVLKFFAGQVVAFKGNKIDFSLDENKELLADASSEFLHEAVETFPYCVGTIPEDFYMIPSLKSKILKECVLYASANIKHQTLAESNKKLGGFLSNANYLENISDFAKELKNYFNVVVKQIIKKEYPELSEDADTHLRCNESSEFLPSSKRVAVLANGVAGDVKKTEEQESEEIRISNEKEAHENISKEELLSMLLDDDDDDLFKENKQQEERIEEERRQIDEHENNLEIDEAQKQLELLLKKDDVEE